MGILQSLEILPAWKHRNWCRFHATIYRYIPIAGCDLNDEAVFETVQIEGRLRKPLWIGTRQDQLAGIRGFI